MVGGFFLFCKENRCKILSSLRLCEFSLFSYWAEQQTHCSHSTSSRWKYGAIRWSLLEGPCSITVLDRTGQGRLVSILTSIDISVHDVSVNLNITKFLPYLTHCTLKENKQQTVKSIVLSALDRHKELVTVHIMWLCLWSWYSILRTNKMICWTKKKL